MATKKTDYQSLSAELDAIMDKLQGEAISIDEAVALYERGMHIVQQLQAQLVSAENKITRIKADFDAQ